METSPTKHSHADLPVSPSMEHLQHQDKRRKSIEVLAGGAEVTAYSLRTAGEPNTLDYRMFFHQGGARVTAGDSNRPIDSGWPLHREVGVTLA